MNSLMPGTSAHPEPGEEVMAMDDVDVDVDVRTPSIGSVSISRISRDGAQIRRSADWSLRPAYECAGDKPEGKDGQK
jgi:hypothetical protein